MRSRGHEVLVFNERGQAKGTVLYQVMHARLQWLGGARQSPDTMSHAIVVGISNRCQCQTLSSHRLSLCPVQFLPCADYAAVKCPSVCPSVRHIPSCIIQVNMSSKVSQLMVAHHSSFLRTDKRHSEMVTMTRSPLTATKHFRW